MCLGQFQGHPSAVKLTIQGRHSRHQARLPPQNSQFETVDSHHLFRLSNPYFKGDRKQEIQREDPKRNGTWEHGVSRGQRLYENWELRNEQDMPTHGQSHCCSTLYLQPELPWCALPCSAKPDISALKLFCQQSKPGIRLPAGLWQLQLSSPWDLPPSVSTSDANLWLLSWEQRKPLLSTAPLNETVAFLMPRTGYHKAYFYQLGSSCDVHSDTDRHRLCSPGSRQCWWSAVLNTYLGQGH